MIRQPEHEPGLQCTVLQWAGRKTPTIRKGRLDYISFNEMGEGVWYYYVQFGNNHSRIVCVSPREIPVSHKTAMGRNWIFTYHEHALAALDKAMKDKEAKEEE